MNEIRNRIMGTNDDYETATAYSGTKETFSNDFDITKTEKSIETVTKYEENCDTMATLIALAFWSKEKENVYDTYKQYYKHKFENYDPENDPEIKMLLSYRKADVSEKKVYSIKDTSVIGGIVETLNENLDETGEEWVIL